MTVAFELDGATVSALNGGPYFKFTEAVSFVIHCRDQAEVDHYWDALCEGGTPSACGWLKDRYGLSWQITPQALVDALASPDPAAMDRVMQAMMRMIKLDVAAIEAAAAG
jgi:predicted 3-demethylubiquinone-9 3-methyltransferase (glyoxalase superfamily)